MDFLGFPSKALSDDFTGGEERGALERVAAGAGGEGLTGAIAEGGGGAEGEGGAGRAEGGAAAGVGAPWKGR